MTPTVTERKAWKSLQVEVELGSDFCSMDVGLGKDMAAKVAHEWGKSSALAELYMDYPQQQVAYIEMINVAELRRRTGRGDALLRAALRWCDEHKVQVVGLVASPIVEFSYEWDEALGVLVRWYSARGFTDLGTAEGVDSVEMARVLPRGARTR